MPKKLIEHIRDMEQAQYTDVKDFLRDIKDNSPERKVEILTELLMYVEEEDEKIVVYHSFSEDV